MTNISLLIPGLTTSNKVCKADLFLEVGRAEIKLLDNTHHSSGKEKNCKALAPSLHHFMTYDRGNSIRQDRGKRQMDRISKNP